MIKYFFTNSFGILFSRILGFIRDVMSANVLGASIYSDIFFVAFKIPNLFRSIFGEGAFSQTFMPFFASCKSRIIFINYIFYRFIFIILSLSILVSIFPSFISSIFVMGFDEATREIISPILAINFYYLDFIFIVMLFSAILHYKHHFATSSFAPALLNVSLIVSLYLSQDMMPLDIVYYMSYGVLVGGFLQVIIHIIALKTMRLDRVFRVNLSKVFRKKENIKENIKDFDKAFLYSMWGSSTAQISSFVDTFLASFLISGSISYLYYANRLFQLPLALFSIALSISLFPIITKLIKDNNDDKAILTIQKGFYFLLYVLSFASIVGILLSKEIVWMLFERGAFDRVDTINSANILSMYLVGLLPFGIAKIFLIWLFSKKMYKISARISTYSLIVNIILSFILVFYFDSMGLALASSISGFILLFLVIKEFGFSRFSRFLLNKIIIWYFIYIMISVSVVLYIKDYIQLLIKV
jgi:putative peptidoglycan lipid II flippase